MNKLSLTVLLILISGFSYGQVTGTKIYKNYMHNLIAYSDNSISFEFMELNEMLTIKSIDFKDTETAIEFFNIVLQVIDQKIDVKFNGVKLSRYMGKAQISKNGFRTNISKSQAKKILSKLKTS